MSDNDTTSTVDKTNWFGPTLPESLATGFMDDAKFGLVLGVNEEGVLVLEHNFPTAPLFLAVLLNVAQEVQNSVAGDTTEETSNDDTENDGGAYYVM